jgi:hypothetical protein
MRIVFLGNFEVPYSTESHHAWTWEQMGHEVVRLQENRSSEMQVLDACERGGTKIFQWTHTHGWPDYSATMVDNIRAMGIKSFSYHLDRYWGIGSRQANYLTHPSFHLDYFFSTDGGNDEGWKSAGINHIYLPPGVVAYATHMGVCSNSHAIPVLFTGSVGYHLEYPFRPIMAERLRANYGSKFQVATGVREEALNNLYASAQVIVGDHIFAGSPLYVSDRLFETVGRGGFIIYPDTPGVTDLIPGLVTYRPQDIDDLIHKIDYYLDIGHEAERIERRNKAFEWVKANGTYTNRLTDIQRILVMGL